MAAGDADRGAAAELGQRDVVATPSPSSAMTPAGILRWRSEAMLPRPRAHRFRARRRGSRGELLGTLAPQPHLEVEVFAEALDRVDRDKRERSSVTGV